MNILEEYSKSFDIIFSVEGLSDIETEIVESYTKKFASDEWNLKK